MTRLEQYAACAFSHFLGFGLELEERAEYQLRLPDIGTIYHEALQRFSERMKDRPAVERRRRDRLLRKRQNKPPGKISQIQLPEIQRRSGGILQIPLNPREKS